MRGKVRWLPGLAFAIGIACVPSLGSPLLAAEIHASSSGRDDAAGTAAEPLRTVSAAQRAARKMAGREPITVVLHAGVFYLPETLVLTADDSGTGASPVTYAAAPGDEVVLSGGSRLELRWEPFRDGILQAAVPDGLAIDQLFVDGRRQQMARYPNFDPAVRHFNGYAADAFGAERAARWSDPRGGFIHAMHVHEWGDYHYLITGKDAVGHVTYEGGWQNNRKMGMHARYRMVENLFEELDAPGEWFHDAKSRTLYLNPPPGIDPSRSTIEVVRLRHLVEFRGTKDRPVRFVNLKGLTFRHAARTFMENREPLLRSDWTTYRGGAIVFEGAEDCVLEDSTLDQLGGNAVFVNNYNRRVAIRGCQIVGAGANGVAFVGDPGSVRSPLFEYNQRQGYQAIDRTPGPKGDNYPADCLVEDCLIHETGRVEKQTAPVQISMSMGITVRHCSIYDVPRAGINISEGTFGGHVVEFCDIFNTVLETGDHGSFNSWGRDRYWGLEGVDLDTVTLGEQKDLPLLDVVRPIILRDNRWRCDHGWDIDLDDGSSRYEIRNNLCLNGGIKLREGFYRVVENNIMVNNSFHPHVWYGNSQDVFRRNIVFGAYRPIRVKKPWGKECDWNLLHDPGRSETSPAARLQQQSGLDAHSLEADAQFIDPAKGDYRVKEDSPARTLGFENFPMDRFGVLRPRLRAIARTPELPTPRAGPRPVAAARPPIRWKGATLRDPAGEEFSALGVGRDAGGVVVAEVPVGSEAAGLGLRGNDFLQSLDGQPLRSAEDFATRAAQVPTGRPLRLDLIRNQRKEALEFEAAGQPSFRFVFGPGQAPPGSTRVAPDAVYSRERGYGFEPGPEITAVGRDASGFCTSRAPFFFSVAVPEGNYRVTVGLVGDQEPSSTTVKAELRRLMLEQAQVPAGGSLRRSFVVNVRTPRIAGGRGSGPAQGPTRDHGRGLGLGREAHPGVQRLEALPRVPGDREGGRAHRVPPRRFHGLRPVPGALRELGADAPEVLQSRRSPSPTTPSRERPSPAPRAPDGWRRSSAS